jgi:hypothetical protein
VVRKLLAYDAWLRAHPDPARLANYMLPENVDYADALAAQRSLAAGEQRYDPAPGAPRVSQLTLVSHEDGAATLEVAFTTPRYRVVDAAGAVVVDTAARDVTSTWRLRYVDGQWRILAAGAAS